MDNEFQNGVVEEGGISAKTVVLLVVLLGAGIFFYLYSIGFVRINWDENTEQVSVEIDEVDVPVDEVAVDSDETFANELPSFSQENIDEFGLQTIFIEPSGVAENGDREYFFEPFGVNFVVPANYAYYYVMDTTWGEMSSGQTVDFLAAEDFDGPSVVDAAGGLVHFGRMTEDQYKEFKDMVEIEGGVKDPDVKIGEFNVQKFVVPSFGDVKLYTYILKNGDYYYDFHAYDDRASFMEDIIKSVKFQG